VERRFGWDCHGLPVEYEIDQTHGFKVSPRVNDACECNVVNEGSLELRINTINAQKMEIEKRGIMILV
jgi:isoleucyl-tRNA synthetase